MLYDKPKTEDGREWIGTCDHCGLELSSTAVHWLILWPGHRDLELYCASCRLALLSSLMDDFWLEGNKNVFRMPWRGKTWEMDHIERQLMIDQLDDDEMIQREEKEEEDHEKGDPGDRA